MLFKIEYDIKIRVFHVKTGLMNDIIIMIMKKPHMAIVFDVAVHIFRTDLNKH